MKIARVFFLPPNSHGRGKLMHFAAIYDVALYNTTNKKTHTFKRCSFALRWTFIRAENDDNSMLQHTLESTTFLWICQHNYSDATFTANRIVADVGRRRNVLLVRAFLFSGIVIICCAVEMRIP